MASRYDVEAKYVPALVCSVPFVFLGYYYLYDLDRAFWQSALTLVVGSLGLTTALFLVVVHLCRDLGKLIEEWRFRGGLDFPTTIFLLDSDTNLSSEQKRRVLSKIKDAIGIDLGGKTKGSIKGRREIHEAVGQIRAMLYKNNAMVLQRNIQYGFTRNLLAGSLIAVIASLIGVILSILSGGSEALSVALVLLACYSLLTLCSFAFLYFMARLYAHTLFNEFLAN